MHTRAMQACLILALSAGTAIGEEYVRMESPADGRTYTIDTDQISVRRALRAVAASTSVSKVPAWLYPGADAKPFDAHFDTASGISQAAFHCGGTEAQVVAFYTQALRGQGLRVSTVQLQENRGTHISGTSDSLAVGVRVERQAGAIVVRTTYTPRQTPRGQHFVAVWYDDRTGILRLRDTSSGEEYEMDRRAIQENNLNRAGGVESDDASMPPWLPVYPGAKASPPGRITWMFKPTAEFVTTAAIRAVYEYYQAAVKAAGATVTSSSIMRSGTPAQDFSAKIVARKDEDQVEIQIGEIVRLNAITSAPRGSATTGIGVRYTVPLR
jgi:hypothetical protein